jgi:HD superfamily phosphohydrolase YqeK
MASTRDIVYLAALLHDIGKFWQRADGSGVKTSEEIDQKMDVTLISMLFGLRNSLKLSKIFSKKT